MPFQANSCAISMLIRDVRQGTRAQDWLWSIPASETKSQARPSMPEGSCRKAPTRRCAPCQGDAIACGARLALAPWDNSDHAKICLGGH